MELSDELVAVCAGSAALSTDGVFELSGGIRELLSRNILRKDLLSKGVRVSQTDDGVVLDISIIVRYGVKIPEVAWDLQENVKKAVEEKTKHQIHVKAVNVRVQGVESTDEDPYDGGKDEQNRGQRAFYADAVSDGNTK